MSKTKQPSVSILLLSYNHENHIEEAVNSIFTQKEHVPEIEIIAIDDGSSDDTPEILRRLQKTSPIKMEVIFNKHEGVTSIAKNLLRMISMAKNKYVAFLAADDSYYPDRFLKQINLMEEDPSCKIVYANGLNYIEGKKSNLVMPQKEVSLLKTKDPCIMYDFVTSNTPLIFIQGMLANRKFLNEIVPFDEDLIADDWVFNIKVFYSLCEKNLKFDYVDKPLFIRNVLETSTSRNHYQHFNRIAEVANRYIPDNNKVFYLNFYYSFLRKFIKIKDFKSSFKLAARYLLLYTGFRTKNTGITNLIPLEGKNK